MWHVVTVVPYLAVCLIEPNRCWSGHIESSQANSSRSGLSAISRRQKDDGKNQERNNEPHLHSGQVYSDFVVLLTEDRVRFYQNSVRRQLVGDTNVIQFNYIHTNASLC